MVAPDGREGNPHERQRDHQDDAVHRAHHNAVATLTHPVEEDSWTELFGPWSSVWSAGVRVRTYGVVMVGSKLLEKWEGEHTVGVQEEEADRHEDGVVVEDDRRGSAAPPEATPPRLHPPDHHQYNCTTENLSNSGKDANQSVILLIVVVCRVFFNFKLIIKNINYYKSFIGMASTYLNQYYYN